MIMIVGLPGAGKTTWGLNMQKGNFEKRYNIIGTDTLIDKMKVYLFYKQFFPMRLIMYLRIHLFNIVFSIPCHLIVEFWKKNDTCKAITSDSSPIWFMVTCFVIFKKKIVLWTMCVGEWSTQEEQLSRSMGSPHSESYTVSQQTLSNR